MGPVTEGSSPPLSDYRISSVVPATVSGEDKQYELKNIDLAFKSHYIKAVYFFDSKSAQGLSCCDFKEPLFPLLDLYSQISGRIRIAESCRPYLKCNDAGVRIVEANCKLTVEEWVARHGYSLHGGLAFGNAIGPEIRFSPLVFIQLTWFQCGGLCVGISWAHLLGDAFSVSTFINQLGKMMAGDRLPPKLSMSELPDLPSSGYKKNPTSAKGIHSDGEYWVTASSYKMKTHSFYVNGNKIDQMLSKVFGSTLENYSSFEILSAVLWKSLSQIREDFGPRTVTICTPNVRRNVQGCINGMLFNTIEADRSVAKSDTSELVRLLASRTLVENHSVEELVKKHEGKEDFLVYGSNLTFVDLEKVNIYGLELNGHKPILANYSLDGVGEEGAILLLPGSANHTKSDGGRGKLVTVILDEKQVEGLKLLLGKGWGIGQCGED